MKQNDRKKNLVINNEKTKCIKLLYTPRTLHPARYCTVLGAIMPRTLQYLTECAVFGLQPLLTVSDTASINTYNSIGNNVDRNI